MNPTATIEPISSEEPLPYDLLYEADPSREAVDDYTTRGTCYAARLDGRIAAVMVLLRTRPFTTELVNLCVGESFRRRGIAREMIRRAVQEARRQGSRTLEVGTGNAGIGQLALYQQCGFAIDSIDKDFFIRHYEEPIFENGIECRHMIRLKMDL